MKHSIEYRPTRVSVKRGLRSAGLSQNRAAQLTGQSPALISMVLNGQARSQPCLNKLAALIAEHHQTEPEPSTAITGLSAPR